MWTGRVEVKSRFGWIGMRWNGLWWRHIVAKFWESSSNCEHHCQSAPIKPQSFGISPAKELINISCFVCVAFRWVLHDLYTFAREKERKVPVPASINAGKNECKRDWFLSRKNAARLCKTVFGGWEKDARPRKRYGNLLNDRQCWRISSVRD